MFALCDDRVPLHQAKYYDCPLQVALSDYIQRYDPSFLLVFNVNPSDRDPRYFQLLFSYSSRAISRLKRMNATLSTPATAGVGKSCTVAAGRRAEDPVQTSIDIP